MNVTKALSKPALAVILFSVLSLFCSMPSHAQEPPHVSSSDYLHDTVGIIERPSEITEKLDRLTRSGTTLHLVLVENFSGPSDPKKWNEKFRSINNIPAQNLLLTVATEGKYQVNIPKSASLTKDQQKSLNDTIKSSLTQAKDDKDWTTSLSAIVDATQNTMDHRSTNFADRNTAQRSSGSFWRALLSFATIASVIGGVIWWYLARRRKQHLATINSHSGPQQMPAPEGPFHDISYNDLDAQSSKLLVAADDAIKSSTQETSFAEAQFGTEAIEPFQKSLNIAQEKLRDAFHYRQLLDDEEPDTAQEQRNYLDSIIRLCTEISNELDANKIAFDELRSLEMNAQDTIEKIKVKARNTQDRLPGESKKLQHIKQEYTGAAIKAIQDNPAEVKERLLFIDTALNNAEEKLSHNKSAEATVAIKAAEEAAAQAHTLLDAIAETRNNLDQAHQALEHEIPEAVSAIAEARAINAVSSRPDLVGAAAGLEETVNHVKNELCTPPLDPIAMTDRLENARITIDKLLNAAHKNFEQRHKRVQDTFAQVLSLARSNIHSAEYYIKGRRGGVNVQARTRISEAQSSLEQALALQGSNNMEGALELAQQANKYAQEANDLAQQNVHEYQHNGMFGGSSGFGLGGAVLGGILIDSMLNSHRGDLQYGDSYDSFGGDFFGGGGYGGFFDNGGDFFGSDSF